MKPLKYSLLLAVLLIPVLTASAMYQTGDTVADFTLMDINGDATNLYDHMGKIIFMNFFLFS